MPGSDWVELSGKCVPFGRKVSAAISSNRSRAVFVYFSICLIRVLVSLPMANNIYEIIQAALFVYVCPASVGVSQMGNALRVCF